MSLSIELPDEFGRSREVLEAIEARTGDKSAVLVHDCAMVFVAFIEFCRVHNVSKADTAKFGTMVALAMGKHLPVNDVDVLSVSKALRRDLFV